MSSLLLYQHILLQHNIKQCNAHGTYTLLQQQSLSHTHYSRIWDKSLHNQRWEYCCERIANNLQLFLFLEFIFFFFFFSFWYIWAGYGIFRGQCVKMLWLLLENCFIMSGKYLNCERKASVSHVWHIPIVRVKGSDCDKWEAFWANSFSV